MAKICHVLSGYLRDDARINRQCQSLVKAGHEVSILTNDGLKNDLQKEIKIIVCKRFWKNRIKTLLLARWQFFEEIKEIDADIYQLHSPELLNLIWYLKKLKKKIVYDAHEDLPNHILEKEWIPWILRRIISLTASFYFYFVFPKLDGIISPHNHVIKKIKKINKTSVEISNFPLINIRGELNFEDYLLRDNTACYAGTVYNYSNQENTIDVVKKIEGLKYKVAGHIDQSFKKKLNQRASTKDVSYLGRIEKEELKEFLNTSTIGLSIYDYRKNLGGNLGSFATNKLFEYMEAGLPVICTDFEMWKKLIEEENCGICIKPNDTKELEKALKFLIDNKEEAFRMGQNGRSAVKNKYNWVSQQEKYNALFNTILNF